MPGSQALAGTGVCSRSGARGIDQAAPMMHAPAWSSQLVNSNAVCCYSSARPLTGKAVHRKRYSCVTQRGGWESFSFRVAWQRNEGYLAASRSHASALAAGRTSVVLGKFRQQAQGRPYFIHPVECPAG
jgi:hypothetical protein